MKNGLLIWNVLLTLVAGYLLINHFGSKNSGGSGSKNAVKDTTTTNTGFRMDSVEANFNMVKDVMKEISRKETDFNNSVKQLDVTFKNQYEEFAKKESMTDEEKENAQSVLNQLGEKLKGQRQSLEQAYQDFVLRKNLEIKKEIETYLKTYNSQKKYSYIISYEPGLFYYRDTAYNVTAEVIKGLNATYKSLKQPK
jgi:outer membrane protein